MSSNTNSGNNLYQAMFLNVNYESALGSSLSDFASLRRRRHRSSLHSGGGSSARPSTRREQYEEATSTTSVMEISWLRRHSQRSPTVDRLPRPPPEDFEDDDDGEESDEEDDFDEEESDEEEAASDLPLYDGSVSIAKDKDTSQRTLMRSSGSLSLELSGLLDFADSFHDEYGVSSLTCDIFLHQEEHFEDHDYTSTTVLDEDYSSTNGDGAYSCSSGATKDLLTTSMTSKSQGKLNYYHEMATPTIKNTVNLSNDIQVFEDDGQQNDDDDFDDSGSLSDSLHASLNASMFSISARQLWCEQEEEDEDEDFRSEDDEEEYETSQNTTTALADSSVLAMGMESMAVVVGSAYDGRYGREEEDDDYQEKKEDGEEENLEPVPLRLIEFEYGDSSFYTQLTNSIISSAGSFPDEPLCVRGGNRDESEGGSPLAPSRKSPPSDKANALADSQSSKLNSSRRSLHRSRSSLSLASGTPWRGLSSPSRST